MFLKLNICRSASIYLIFDSLFSVEVIIRLQLESFWLKASLCSKKWMNATSNVSRLWMHSLQWIPRIHLSMPTSLSMELCKVRIRLKFTKFATSRFISVYVEQCVIAVSLFDWKSWVETKEWSSLSFSLSFHFLSHHSRQSLNAIKASTVLKRDIFH